MSKDGKGEKYERDVKKLIDSLDGVESDQKVQKAHPNAGDRGIDWKGKTTDEESIKEKLQKIKDKKGSD